MDSTGTNSQDSELSAPEDSNSLAADPNSLGLSKRSYQASGQAIGQLMATALKHPKLLSLAAGFVDNETLPCDAMRETLARLGSNPDQVRVALQYDTTSGNRELRDLISRASYAEWTEAVPSAEQIILTAGSNQFLHLLAEAILDPGDIVLAAAPTYFVFLGTLRGIGARVIGVHADENGICIDSLKSQLEELKKSGQAHRLKAIYSVTDFDNPAGSTLSLERRQELIELVSAWRAEQGPCYLLSDNAYEQLRYEGQAIQPILTLDKSCQDFVFEMGTYSKSFSPGIRVGWGVVPKAFVEPLLDMKSNMDFGSPHFSQVLIKELLLDGTLERHLPTILEAYRIKRDAMLAALTEHLGNVEGVSWRHPQGGLYVWLTLPENVDASENGKLWKAATENGVLYVPGHHCYPDEGIPVAKNTIRLSFGVQSPAGIQEGIARLASAVRELV